MAIRFPCPTCTQTIKVHDTLVGERVKCRNCKQLTTVPIQEPVAAPAAPAAPAAATAGRVRVREPKQDRASAVGARLAKWGLLGLLAVTLVGGAAAWWLDVRRHDIDAAAKQAQLAKHAAPPPEAARTNQVLEVVEDVFALGDFRPAGGTEAVPRYGVEIRPGTTARPGQGQYYLTVRDGRGTEEVAFEWQQLPAAGPLVFESIKGRGAFVGAAELYITRAPFSNPDKRERVSNVVPLVR